METSRHSSRRLVSFLLSHDGLKAALSIVVVVASLIFANQVFGLEFWTLWALMLGVIGLLLMIVGLIEWYRESKDDDFYFDDHY